MATLNAYQVKWVVIVPVVGKEFKAKYRAAFRNAGFNAVGFGNDVFALHYNSNSAASVERMINSVKKLNAKICSYKKHSAVLSFTITDKQFGLIGSTKTDWAKCKVPTEMGVIPVTYNQMYEAGCIPLKGSQARYNHPNKLIFK